MTLSNFDWTDKDSVKWFIMLPTGHEGPYSLNHLIKLKGDKKIAGNVRVWAEGLHSPVELTEAINHEEIIELPPLPEDDIPPIPLPDEETPEAFPEDLLPDATESEVKSIGRLPRTTLVGGLLALIFISGLYFLLSGSEKFDFSRLPKMGLQLHERILKENQFDGWDKPIFFKEYLPDDHSHIWLVTSGFQKCDVEANFSSLKDKLLSISDEKIAFKTKGQLRNHVVEFSTFDFVSGNKIIPGLYEMDVKATDCKWDGIVPLLMNGFSSPEKEYIARTKVILFSKGADEFNQILDKLLKKKMEVARREQNQNEIFWQDLKQKFETLQAITLQIEQHLLDFLDEESNQFTKNLKPMVDKYTRSFGSFLTSFVVENENYFKNLNTEAKGASQKRNYELMVKLTSKRIGLETMKFIEEFQRLKKNPSKAEVASFSERVKKAFVAIKNDINQKISQISEDRSK